MYRSLVKLSWGFRDEEPTQAIRQNIALGSWGFSVLLGPFGPILAGASAPEGRRLGTALGGAVATIPGAVLTIRGALHDSPGSQAIGRLLMAAGAGLGSYVGYGSTEKMASLTKLAKSGHLERVRAANGGFNYVSSPVDVEEGRAADPETDLVVDQHRYPSWDELSDGRKVERVAKVLAGTGLGFGIGYGTGSAINYLTRERMSGLARKSRGLRSVVLPAGGAILGALAALQIDAQNKVLNTDDGVLRFGDSR